MNNSRSPATVAAAVVVCAVAAFWLASGWGVLAKGLLRAAHTSHAAEPTSDTVKSSGDRTAVGEKPQPAKPPPLQVDKSAPLLLDEPPPRPPRKAFAQNEACYVCHENYREESFAEYHARAEVGCVKCHGESLAHRSDESNLTPPEIMFAAEAIENNCKTCHDTHDAPAAKVVALWLEKCQQRSNPRELLCTDCHGEHRLAVRTVVWDKRTGKLQRRPEHIGTAAPKAE